MLVSASLIVYSRGSGSLVVSEVGVGSAGHRSQQASD